MFYYKIDFLHDFEQLVHQCCNWIIEQSWIDFQYYSHV